MKLIKTIFNHKPLFQNKLILIAQNAKSNKVYYKRFEQEKF